MCHEGQYLKKKVRFTMRPTWLTRLVSSPVAAQEFEKSQPFAFCLAGDISILHAILALMPLSGPDLLKHQV